MNFRNINCWPFFVAWYLNVPYFIYEYNNVSPECVNSITSQWLRQIFNGFVTSLYLRPVFKVHKSIFVYRVFVPVVVTRGHRHVRVHLIASNLPSKTSKLLPTFFNDFLCSMKSVSSETPFPHLQYSFLLPHYHVFSPVTRCCSVAYTALTIGPSFVSL